MPRAVLLSLAIVLSLIAPTLGAPLVFDFEDGTLQGWTVVEGEFGMLVCNRALFHHQTEIPYNKHGEYFLSTLEQHDYTPSDHFMGIVESPVILLEGQTIDLLVGGGSHPTTYVGLFDLEGAELARASGIDQQEMQEVRWSVPEAVGRPVILRIVDQHTGGWGHVTLDHVRLDGTVDEAATREYVLGRASREALRGFLAVIDPLDAALAAMGNAEEARARLDGLRERAEASGDAEEIRGLRREAEGLGREALLRHPLVGGQPILFVVRPQYLPDHHNTATMFQTGEINHGSFRGGSALKLLEVGTGETTTLLEVPEGIVRDPEVSFDGTRILFSMRRNAADDYHVYEMNADGSGLRQLTYGAGLSDIDPLYLPDGTIVFSSTREPKYCMCNRHIMANLFRMEADGANIRQIGRSTLFEGHGALMEDGRILYDRWEYVDRNFGDAQGLWVCNPDGTNHALYWGNNTPSPGGVIDARPIPGTDRAIAVFGSCHDRPWGALAIIDRAFGMDGVLPVVRTWPEGSTVLMPGGHWDSFMAVNPKYEDPYPLSDSLFLCSRMTGEGERMGIALLDLHGNDILLHVEGAGCYDPMPLAPRPAPPVLPDRLDLARQTGYLYLTDAYEGQEMAGVERGAVRYLRIVESPEKRFWTPSAWPGQGEEAPAMGWHDFNNKRVIGTVPVHPDGSAYAEVPADRFIYFQLLDENRRMIHSMRSGTILRPGERLGCSGCHEDRRSSTVNASPLALEQPPAAPQLDGDPEREIGYVRDVQPILDTHCVTCHDYDTEGGEVLNLSGGRTLAFNMSYHELWRKGYVGSIGAGPAETQPAYSWGSHASRLLKTLDEGHYGVEVPEADMRRLQTWIDLNAPYYPTYASAYPGNLYGRSPLGSDDLARLRDLSGIDFTNWSLGATVGHLVDFGRPEKSLVLTMMQDPSPEARTEALSIIERGRQMLAERPRADMEGFALDGVEADRERRYQERASWAVQVRQAILGGTRVYPGRQ